MSESQTTDFDIDSFLSKLATDSKVDCRWSKVKRLGEDYSCIRAITNGPAINVQALKNGFHKFPLTQQYLSPTNSDQNETHHHEEGKNDSNKTDFEPGILFYGLNIPLKSTFKESNLDDDNDNDAARSNLGYEYSQLKSESQSEEEARPSKRVKVSDSSQAQQEGTSDHVASSEVKQTKRNTENYARFILFHKDDSRVKHYAGSKGTSTSDRCENLQCSGAPYSAYNDNSELEAICDEQLPHRDSNLSLEDEVNWNQLWKEECFKSDFIESLLNQEKLDQHREIHHRGNRQTYAMRILYNYRPDLTQSTDIPTLIDVADAYKFRENGIGTTHNRFLIPYDSRFDRLAIEDYHNEKRQWSRIIEEAIKKVMNDEHAFGHSEEQN